MARAIGVLLASLLIMPLAVAQTSDDGSGEKAAPEATWSTVKTAYVPVKKFEIKLPPAVTGGMMMIGGSTTRGKAITGTSLPLPGPSKKVVREGTRKLGVDTDGDGEADEWLKSTKKLMQMVLEYPDGTKSPYQIMVTRGTGGFTFISSCYRQFSWKGQTIRLIDQDNDGKFNTVRSDAMIVGRGDAAVHLSELFSVRGTIYELKVNPAGTEVQVREWSGQTGQVDLSKGFKARGKLSTAMLVDGNRAFDVAPRGTAVPVGTYQLKWGVVKAGNASAEFRSSVNVTVTAEGNSEIKLGAPFRMDFAKTGAKGKITISYHSCKVYGSAGEEYYNFSKQLVPYVQIRHAETQKILSKGKFDTG